MPTVARFTLFRVPLAGFAAARRGVPLLRILLERALAWQQEARERHALHELDRHGLADAGLSRAAVLAELAKARWRRRGG